MIMLGLCVGACASGGQEGGYANYDALKRATDDCAANGGTLRLKPQGDAQSITAYACERK
jgi:hypothetical protein